MAERWLAVPHANCNSAKRFDARGETSFSRKAVVPGLTTRWASFHPLASVPDRAGSGRLRGKRTNARSRGGGWIRRTDKGCGTNRSLKNGIAGASSFVSVTNTV